MELIKATKENGVFHDLEAQWQGQHSKYEDDFSEYLIPFREHSKKIIANGHSNYFVYVLSNNGAYDAFLHINYAQIKRLPGYTLRALEICLAPDYDYQDVPREHMMKICTDLFTELIELSNGELTSETVKIHLGPLDRSFFSAFASCFGSGHGLDIALQGAWLVTRKI